MTARHKKLDPLRVPRSGTTLRRLYDSLLSGDHVSVSGVVGTRKYQTAIGQLRDFYGCEFVSRRGPRGWVQLRGRWDGPYFVPVERLDTYGWAA